MASLPAAGTFSTPGITVATHTAALDSTVEYVRQLLGGKAPTELVIATGAVTAAAGVHTLDTEGGAATDDLTNVVVSTNMADGQFLLVGIESDSRVVVLKHEAGGEGQLSLRHGQDLTIVSTKQWVLFRIDITASPDTLREVARFGFDAENVLKVEATATVASPRTLTELESGCTFSNEGATAKVGFVLPGARAGLRYRFVVQDTDGINVKAAAGDTIGKVGTVTPAAGNVDATAQRAVIELLAINGTEWIAQIELGTWTYSS